MDLPELQGADPQYGLRPGIFTPASRLETSGSGSPGTASAGSPQPFRTNDFDDLRLIGLLGAVYGVAGVCAGPILGSVLTVAALDGNSAYWAVLMSLSVGLGIFLLVTDGTTTLGGVLTIGQQYEVETWALGATSTIPDVVMLLVALLLTAIVALVFTVRRQQARLASREANRR